MPARKKSKLCARKKYAWKKPKKNTISNKNKKLRKNKAKYAVEAIRNEENEESAKEDVIGENCAAENASATDNSDNSERQEQGGMHTNQHTKTSHHYISEESDSNISPRYSPLDLSAEDQKCLDAIDLKGLDEFVHTDGNKGQKFESNRDPYPNVWRNRGTRIPGPDLPVAQGARAPHLAQQQKFRIQ